MSAHIDSFDTESRATDLDPEHPEPILTPWGTMALYVDGGEVLCVQAFCPHLDGPLFQGSVAGGAITCPWHLWRFDLRTGRRLGLLGIPMPGFVKRCDVSTSERGTLVLHAPIAP